MRGTRVLVISNKIPVSAGSTEQMSRQTWMRALFRVPNKLFKTKRKQTISY